MRLTRRGTIIATVLVLIITTSLVDTALAYTVHIGLLAVTDHSGEVIPADVSVSRGSGGLVIGPSEYIHPSVLYSTRVGYVLASLLSHIPPSQVHVRVLIHTNTEVQGPSASGFLTTVIFLGIRGVYPRNDTTMTGMISLTGFILPVAGIKYKVEAAAKAGYKRVILPYGENAPTTKRNGVKILHACSLEDSVADAAFPLPGLTGINLSYINSSINTMVRENIDTRVFDNYTRFFIKALGKLLKEYRGTDKQKYEELEKLAKKALENGDSYSAASIAFYSVVNIATRIASSKGFTYLEKLLNISLQQEIQRATTALSKASEKVLRGSSCDAWRVEALAAASSRLYLARHAATSPRGDKVLALFRAVSALSWLELAKSVNGPQVPCDLLKETIRNYVDYASLSYSYINSVLPFLAKQLLMPDNRSITAWLKDARTALSNGDYVLALGLAENTIASFEDVLVDYASLPLGCVVRHVYFLLENSAIGYSLPALLYSSYALTYARDVGKIIGRQNFAPVLVSDASTWALFGVFGWAINQSIATTPSLTRPLSNYTPSPSITPIVAEALVLGVAAYAVASLSRRASSQEL